jgi:hypothetical protein
MIDKSKLCGTTNNRKVSQRYKNCLPDDSPELMPLDCHLFANLQEGAFKNVALTFHIKEGNKNDQDPDPNSDIKYSFMMPKKVFDALQWTLKSRCPSKKCIKEDLFCVYDETLQHIINAECIILKTPPRKLSGMASAERQRSIIDERHLQLTLLHLKASIVC